MSYNANTNTNTNTNAMAGSTGSHHCCNGNPSCHGNNWMWSPATYVVPHYGWYVPLATANYHNGCYPTGYPVSIMGNMNCGRYFANLNPATTYPTYAASYEQESNCYGAPVGPQVWRCNGQHQVGISHNHPFCNGVGPHQQAVKEQESQAQTQHTKMPTTSNDWGQEDDEYCEVYDYQTPVTAKGPWDSDDDEVENVDVTAPVTSKGPWDSDDDEAETQVDDAEENTDDFWGQEDYTADDNCEDYGDNYEDDYDGGNDYSEDVDVAVPVTSKGPWDSDDEEAENIVNAPVTAKGPWDSDDDEAENINVNAPVTAKGPWDSDDDEAETQVGNGMEEEKDDFWGQEADTDYWGQEDYTADEYCEEYGDNYDGNDYCDGQDYSEDVDVTAPVTSKGPWDSDDDEAENINVTAPVTAKGPWDSDDDEAENVNANAQVTAKGPWDSDDDEAENHKDNDAEEIEDDFWGQEADNDYGGQEDYTTEEYREEYGDNYDEEGYYDENGEYYDGNDEYYDENGEYYDENDGVQDFPEDVDGTVSVASKGPWDSDVEEDENHVDNGTVGNNVDDWGNEVGGAEKREDSPVERAMSLNYASQSHTPFESESECEYCKPSTSAQSNPEPKKALPDLKGFFEMLEKFREMYSNM